MALLTDIALFFVLIKLLIWFWNLLKTERKHLPPGRVGLPYIGETISFLRTAPSGKFYTDRERRYGPIFKTSILGLQTVYVSGPEPIRQLFQLENNGLVSWWPPSMQNLLGDGSLGAAPPHEHHNRKKHMAHALRTVDYKHLSEDLEDIVNYELAGWAQKKSVEVHHSAKFMAIRCACVALLGLNLTRDEVGLVARLLKGFEEGLFTVPINLPGTTYHKAMQSKKKLYSFLASKFHEQGGNTSILSATGWPPNIMSDAITELLFGAQETLSSFMTCSMLLLTKHPEVIKKVQDSTTDNTSWNKATYVDFVAKETLRMYPPIAGGFRLTTKEIQIGEYVIPKGWGVTFNIRSTHNQSIHFKHPDKFNPDQWLDIADQLPQYHYIPFGGGAHACVGRDYARVIWRLFLTTLVKKYTWELLTEDPVLLCLPVVRPENGMWVVMKALIEE